MVYNLSTLRKAVLAAQRRTGDNRISTCANKGKIEICLVTMGNRKLKTKTTVETLGVFDIVEAHKYLDNMQ